LLIGWPCNVFGLRFLFAAVVIDALVVRGSGRIKVEDEMARCRGRS
jgi:hypothetical protein